MPEPLRWLAWFQLHLTRTDVTLKVPDADSTQGSGWSRNTQRAATDTCSPKPPPILSKITQSKIVLFLKKKKSLVMCFGRRDGVVQKKHQQQCPFALALRHSCFILHPCCSLASHKDRRVRSPSALRSLSAPPWLSDFGGQHTGSWCGICSTSVIVC